MINEALNLSAKTWSAEVRVASYLQPHPDDPRTPRPDRPLTEERKRWVQVYGAGEIRMSRLSARSTVPRDYGYASNEERWLLTSDEPFVAVTRSSGYDSTVRGWNGKHYHAFTPAGVACDNNLIRLPALVGELEVSGSLMKDPSFNSERMLGWVQLSKLVSLTQLKVGDLLRRFAGFSASNYYEPNVPVLRHDGDLLDPLNPAGWELVTRLYTTDKEDMKSFCGGETAWGGTRARILDAACEETLVKAPELFWVPEAFARVVMYLTQFGYQPNGRGAVILEAPMPQAPPLTMETLSPEDLRDLQPLRMQLEDEISRADFQQAAERTLRLTDVVWIKSPQMDDELGGVGQYYNDFASLSAFNGRLVISTCYWTRAGASKTSNYYAGCMTVLDEKADDPRRAPARLRIWFWPGELVRNMPDGSAGGLCPSDVPADIAVAVQQFLVELGYMN